MIIESGSFPSWRRHVFLKELYKTESGWGSLDDFILAFEEYWEMCSGHEMIILGDDLKPLIWSGVSEGCDIHHGRLVDVCGTIYIGDEANRKACLKEVTTFHVEFTRAVGCSVYARSIHLGSDRTIVKYKEV